MKIILHIGTQKTGTTLLQRWLYSNKTALSEQGVYLSDQLGRPNNRKLASYVCERLDSRDRSLGIRSMEDKSDYFNGFEDQFSAEVEAAGKKAEVMIVSSEHFHSDLRNSSEVQRLSSILSTLFDTTSIVVYFREPASLRKSVYSTHLRNDGRLSLDKYSTDIGPHSYFFNALAAANLWSSSFGAAQFNPAVYDRAQFESGDIRRDFLKKIGIPVDESRLDFTIHAANERISRVQAVALRAVNQHLGFWPGADSWRQTSIAIKSELLEAPELRLGEIPDHLGVEIAQRFSEVNKEFFQRFLPGGYFPMYEGSSISSDESQHVDLDQVVDVIYSALDTTIRALKERGLADGEGVRLHRMARRLQNEGDLKDARYLLKLALKTNPNDGAMKRRLREIDRSLRETS